MWTLILVTAVAQANFSSWSQLDRRWDGDARGDRFGRAIQTTDLDGDRSLDVIVGAPQASTDSGDSTGCVKIYSGRRGRLAHRVVGENEGDRFGTAIAVLDDDDGDGHLDILIGAPGYDGLAGENCGKLYLVSGACGRVLRTWEGTSGDEIGAAFGHSLAVIEDVDGNQKKDFIVGSYTHGVGARFGKVEVYSSVGTHPLKTWIGENAWDGFGYSVSALHQKAGNESYVVVGAPFSGGSEGRLAGKVFVFSYQRQQLVHVTEGGRATALFGLEVAALGDLDGDGTDDFGVGAPHRDVGDLLNAGRVTVLSGATGKSVWEVVGEGSDMELGAAIARIDDVDLDGWSDVLIGAPGHSVGGEWGVGSVRLHCGRTGARKGIFWGRNNRDRFGDEVAAGWAEVLIVGAPSAVNAKGEEAGVVISIDISRGRSS